MGNAINTQKPINKVILCWIESLAYQQKEIGRKEIVETWEVSGQQASAFLQALLELHNCLEYSPKTKRYHWRDGVSPVLKIPENIATSLMS